MLMKKSKKIQYQLSTPTKWYKKLHEQLPSRLDENQFILSREFGLGGLKHFNIQEGLWIYQMDFLLHEDLNLHQIPKNDNDCFLLNFYLSNAKIQTRTANKSYELGLENISVILTSAMTDVHTFIPANKKFHLINIGFSKKWLETNVLTDGYPSLKPLFEHSKPIYIAENLDFKLKNTK